MKGIIERVSDRYTSHMSNVIWYTYERARVWRGWQPRCLPAPARKGMCHIIVWENSYSDVELFDEAIKYSNAISYFIYRTCHGGDCVSLLIESLVRLCCKLEQNNDDTGLDLCRNRHPYSTSEDVLRAEPACKRLCQLNNEFHLNFES